MRKLLVRAQLSAKRENMIGIRVLVLSTLIVVVAGLVAQFRKKEK